MCARIKSIWSVLNTCRGILQSTVGICQSGTNGTGTIAIVLVARMMQTLNPFNPAKIFDITHKVYIPMKEETLYFSFMELFCKMYWNVRYFWGRNKDLWTPYFSLLVNWHGTNSTSAVLLYFLLQSVIIGRRPQMRPWSRTLSNPGGAIQWRIIHPESRVERPGFSNSRMVSYTSFLKQSTSEPIRRTFD
jgi:hypothetical protein